MPDLARRAYEYGGRLYRLAGAYTASIVLLDRALEYQEMFNFRFDADTPPQAAVAEAGIFTP